MEHRGFSHRQRAHCLVFCISGNPGLDSDFGKVGTSEHDACFLTGVNEVNHYLSLKITFTRSGHLCCRDAGAGWRTGHSHSGYLPAWAHELPTGLMARG